MFATHLLQALRKSLLEVQRVEHEAPLAPVVYPTEDEWRDFYGFIEKVKPLGLANGILKIIPPASMRDTPDGTVASLYACLAGFALGLLNVGSKPEIWDAQNLSFSIAD